MDTVRKEVESLKDEVIKLRRDFHMHPELAFKEKRTAKIIENYLKKCGLEVKIGIAKTGVVGLLRGKEKGKTILLRADMDALPIEEMSKIPYKSVNEGVMHACGHDAHTAMLLVAAKILSHHKEEIKGNIKFVFQPSEEKDPGGAAKMIEEGVLEKPHVNRAYGLHLGNMFPCGVVAIKPGIFTAQADRFSIRITGKGGHGAYPHTSVDPVLIASHTVIALQAIVGREVDPLQPAVLTVGKISSGDTFNVIPEYAELLGTVRTLDPKIAHTVSKRIEQISKGVAKTFRGTAELSYHFGYPPIINDSTETKFVQAIVKGVVGAGKIINAPISMGGEDMSYFLKKVPGVFFWLGSQNKKKGLDKPHHSAYFNIDEDVLPIGVEMHVRIAMNNLKEFLL